MRKIEVLGENLVRTVPMAMDEAPARREGEHQDDDGPTIGALSGLVEDAAEALEGIRGHLKRGAEDSQGRLSFDAVRRRVADARDALDALEEQLGGARKGADSSEQGRETEAERDLAFRLSRDGEHVDHRHDWRSRAAGGPDNPAVDGKRGMALDRQRAAADSRANLDEIFTRTAHDYRAGGDQLDAIFRP